ncbi:PREDICTED: cell adhesion molecule 1-like [Papilio xuthus]|uniref:Cell adhesion molecule 1-like n=1 Tax=Papilio xuthus TaxID=66420 RepID=A0AAJ6ZCG4_PAPXU|nr:PREDICTED: cell adhesion molecule 1-like [Papilio xuthus]
MQGCSFNLVCLIICCVQSVTDTQQIEINITDNQISDYRNNKKDGLAISREIFRNITKKLRENFNSDVITNDNQKMKVKTNEQRNFAPYQGYHHYEQHWGPYFEESNVTQKEAHVGSEALLNCRVVMLKDKTVMWLRNTSDVAQLLTVGREAHAGDSRITVKFQYPNNWRISINPVKTSDEGLYMCQISTHPPRTIYSNLTVLPPVLTINGDKLHVVKDRFYKAGSSIKLSCAISEKYILSTSIKTSEAPTTVTTTPMTTTTELTTKMSTVFNSLEIMLNRSWSIATTTITSTVSISTTRKTSPEIEKTTTATSKSPDVMNNVYGILWKKQGKLFNDNITWRNISATINIASASQEDNGIYTCQLRNHSQVTTIVHVLIGENQAAVHHDTWNKGSSYWQVYNRPILSLY